MNKENKEHRSSRSRNTASKEGRNLEEGPSSPSPRLESDLTGEHVLVSYWMAGKFTEVNFMEICLLGAGGKWSTAGCYPAELTGNLPLGVGQREATIRGLERSCPWVGAMHLQIRREPVGRILLLWSGSSAG